MQFTQIKYFLSVARHLNFTAAAHECAVSQPALSKAIQKLECDLGRPLLLRNTHDVQLTEFGRTMRIHLEQIDDNVRQALATAREASDGPSQILNVGVMCTIGPRRFAPFLGAFRASHPDVTVALHDVAPLAIPELLLSGALDVVFCARSAEHDQRFHAEELFEEGMEVAFAAGHKFSSLDEVSLEDISAERYVDRLKCEFREKFLEVTRASGIDLNVAASTDREDWAMELVRQGHGVCVVASSTAELVDVQHRPVRELRQLRQLELVYTNESLKADSFRSLLNAAQRFNWSI